MHCPADNAQCVHGDKCRLEHQCREDPKWSIPEGQQAQSAVMSAFSKCPGTPTICPRALACADAGHCLAYAYHQAQEKRQTLPYGRDIGWAVDAMRSGKLVRRAGWNGKGMWLFHVAPGMVAQGRYAADGALGGNKEMLRQEYIAMKTAQDYVIPWLCSQADLLAQDWELVQ